MNKEIISGILDSIMNGETDNDSSPFDKYLKKKKGMKPEGSIKIEIETVEAVEPVEIEEMQEVQDTAPSSLIAQLKKKAKDKKNK